MSVKSLSFVIMVIGVLAITGASYGAGDGCESESNDRITAELALCSVHAYNIGETANPGTATMRQGMNEVIALKTTVMAQQMYKQYEYMDAMLKRFKTQLSKAVLLAQIQKAAGTSANNASSRGVQSGTTGTAGARVTGLADAKECATEYIYPQDIFECLAGNSDKINANIGSVSNNDIKRQMEKDIEIIRLYNQATTNTACQPFANKNLPTECNSQTPTQLTACNKKIRACISANLTEIQKQNRIQINNK